MKASSASAESARPVAPRAVRQLRADMALRGLTLRDAASLAGVNYHVASAVLRGRTVHAAHLAALRRAIHGVSIP